MQAIRILTCLCVTLFCIVGSHAGAAQNITDENLVQLLRQTLQEKPELILDVLRQNSESVLDIAQQGSTLRRKRSLEAQWRDDIKQPKKMSLDNRPAIGPASAPVTIVAFSDFTCPYCEQGAQTAQRIIEIYGDKVRYIFKHLPLYKDNVGRLASEYVVAAGLQSSEMSWALYKVFFQQRQKLITDGETFMKDAAKMVGLNQAKLATDIKSKKVKDIIDEDMADAKRLGAEATPYFFVNNLVIRGAVPQELFSAAVDMALQHAK